MEAVLGEVDAELVDFGPIGVVVIGVFGILVDFLAFVNKDEIVGDDTVVKFHGPLGLDGFGVGGDVEVGEDVVFGEDFGFFGVFFEIGEVFPDGFGGFAEKAVALCLGEGCKDVFFAAVEAVCF